MTIEKDLTQVDQERLLQFSYSLDCLIPEQTTLFNIGLLQLLDEQFSYSKSAIIFREDDEQYTQDTITYNMNEELSNFYQYFQITDLFKPFFDSDPRLLAGQRCVLRDTDALGQKELFRFRLLFNNLAGIYHLLFMTFSFSVTVLVFKSKAEGGFSDYEMLLFDQISRMIDSRACLVQNLAAHIMSVDTEQSINISRAKDHYLDSLDIGIIILNRNYHFIYRNAASHLYTDKISPDKTMEQHFRKLCCSKKYILGAKNDCSVSVAYDNDYCIKIELFPCASTKRYSECLYFISIKPMQETAKDTAPSEDARLEMFKTKYGLSEREMQIVLAISEGNTYSMVADSLFISINTVRSHIKSIYRKLNITNQRELLAIFNKN